MFPDQTMNRDRFEILQLLGMKMWSQTLEGSEPESFTPMYVIHGQMLIHRTWTFCFSLRKPYGWGTVLREHIAQWDSHKQPRYTLNKAHHPCYKGHVSVGSPLYTVQFSVVRPPYAVSHTIYTSQCYEREGLSKSVLSLCTHHKSHKE